MVREIQTQLDHARELEHNFNTVQMELNEYKERQAELENIANERGEEIIGLKGYIQQVS